MQRLIFLFATPAFLFIQSVKAQQQYDQLPELKNHAVKVYYSSGHEQRAALVAQRVDQAMIFHQQLLGLSPQVTLLVLSAADWDKYIASPVVYGMPHYNKNSTLIVAAEDNAFWKSFLPPPGQLPPAIQEQVQTVYRSGDSLSMQAFFDLLAIHELGHAFQMQGGLTMQRNWMSELFANILLHTYIAEKEPGSLAALTLFPQMVISGGAKGFKYTDLRDFQEHYSEIATQYPKNYGWYQCRLHSAAANIYNAAGKEVCKKLWDALKDKKAILADEELVVFLETTDKSIADMVRNWDSEAK